MRDTQAHCGDHTGFATELHSRLGSRRFPSHPVQSSPLGFQASGPLNPGEPLVKERAFLQAAPLTAFEKKL